MILRWFYLLKDLADKVQIVHAYIHTRGPGTRNACANSIVQKRDGGESSIDINL